jgi:hypothetical protein
MLRNALPVSGLVGFPSSRRAVWMIAGRFELVIFYGDRVLVDSEPIIN